MMTRTGVLATVSLTAALIALPTHVRGQRAPNAAEHEQHHPAAPTAQTHTPTPAPRMNMTDMAAMMARMKDNDARLDALVKQLKEAQGQTKLDAIAETLTVLIEERRNTCGPMMEHMMSMMNMMGGAPQGQDALTDPKK